MIFLSNVVSLKAVLAVSAVLLLVSFVPFGRTISSLLITLLATDTSVTYSLIMFWLRALFTLIVSLPFPAVALFVSTGVSSFVGRTFEISSTTLPVDLSVRIIWFQFNSLAVELTSCGFTWTVYFSPNLLKSNAAMEKVPVTHSGFTATALKLL